MSTIGATIAASMGGSMSPPWLAQQGKFLSINGLPVLIDGLRINFI